MQNITKYMCTVETKNYPVNTIFKDMLLSEKNLMLQK